MRHAAFRNLIFPALLLATVGTSGGPAIALVVYQNDFETSIGAEWSSTGSAAAIATTPLGTRHFLGEFVNDTVSLTLTGLPAHSSATVGLDLFVLRSWDGMNANFGCNATSCETWSLEVAGGATLVSTNFNNIGGFPGAEGVQAYPDPVGVGLHPFHTGAIEVGTLGFPALIQDTVTQRISAVCCFDAVYHFDLSFLTTSTTLTLDFSARDLQILDPALQQQFNFFAPDESWGLDNVLVAVAVPQPGSAVLVGGVLLVAWTARRVKRALGRG